MYLTQMTTATMKEPKAAVPIWCRIVRRMPSASRKCGTSLLPSIVGVKYQREMEPATAKYCLSLIHI